MQQKIAFVINSLAGGGAERVLTTLLAHSKTYQAQFSFELVLIDDEPDSYSLPDWLPVSRLGGNGRLRDSIRRVRAHFAKTKPDLALSFLTRANICTILAMQPLRRPAIISERIHTSVHLGNRISGKVAKFLVRRYYPKAARVLCVSDGVGADLVARFGVAADRIEVIYNPFDLARIAADAMAPTPSVIAAPYALAMGRLVDAKNFGFLLHAYQAADIPHHLVIAGEGNKRAELEALIDTLGLAGRVTLPGFVANPYALMQAADFYILSSNAEGFPNGLVEAMAVGLPVLATDCPSGPSEILEAKGEADTVVAGNGGLLVPCDDVSAMTKGLQRMAQAETRDRLAPLAHKRAQDFDVSAAVARYWGAIISVLDARNSG